MEAVRQALEYPIPTQLFRETRAHFYLKDERYEEALSEYRFLTIGADGDLMMGLSVALIGLDRFFDQADSSAVGNPQPAPTYHGARVRGDAWLQKGDVRRAIASYRLAVTLRPDSAMAKVRLAEALLRCKEADEANDLLNQATMQDPDNLYALSILAFARELAGDLAQARVLLDKLDGLGFDESDFFFSRVRVARKQWRIGEAFRIIRKWRGVDLNFAGAVDRLANTVPNE